MKGFLLISEIGRKPHFLWQKRRIKTEKRKKTIFGAVCYNRLGCLDTERLWLSLVNQGKKSARAVIKNNRDNVFAAEELSMESGTAEKAGKLEEERVLQFHPYQSRYLCFKPTDEKKTQEKSE